MIDKTAGRENPVGFIVITALAVILFVPLFIFRQIGPLDFWWWMSANLILLIVLSFISGRNYRKLIAQDFSNRIVKKIMYGILSAAVLYLVFYIGNILIRYLLDFASENIQSIYGFKGEAPDWRILVLMLLVIGPGEEFFWRGWMQRFLENRLGKISGYLAATAVYTLVHVATGNLVLVLAALVCGLFWGWLFMKYKSVLLNAVSHTVWDIAAFVVFPFVVA